jgi:hypothetical protein
MIIDNLDFIGLVFIPDEADAVLVIDANAVLQGPGCLDDAASQVSRVPDL